MSPPPERRKAWRRNSYVSPSTWPKTPDRVVRQFGEKELAALQDFARLVEEMFRLREFSVAFRARRKAMGLGLSGVGTHLQVSGRKWRI